MQPIVEILKQMMRPGSLSVAAGADLRRVIYEARKLDVWVDITHCPNCGQEVWVYDFTGKPTEKLEPRVYVIDRLERNHEGCYATKKTLPKVP